MIGFLKKIQLHQAKIALLPSLAIMLIHNFFCLYSRLTQLIETRSNFFEYYKFFLEIGFNLFALFTFFFLCSFNKIIFRSAVFILFLLSTIFAFVYNKFGILIDQTIIFNAIDSASEADSLINFYSLILYLFFLTFLPFILICKIEIIKKDNEKTPYLIAATFFFFVANFANFDRETRRGIAISYSPISLIDSLVEYFGDIHPYLKNKKNLTPIASIIPDVKLDAKKVKNLKVVLIIGESARSMNFSINGYKRKTTPELEKVNNLLSFKNVSPCSNLTSYSVSCMLSYKTSNEFLFSNNNEESIAKLFEKLGFTTAWFSTQKAVGDDNVVLAVAMQHQKYLFGNSIAKIIGGNKIYDEYLLNFLDKEIDNKEDNFVVLQGQGSHFLFDDRYPEEFKKFTPTCRKTNPADCEKQAMINSYDNSILYTDHFINSVITRLKDKNAILFYISDHGQFLGEDGIYYHGNNEFYHHGRTRGNNQKEHQVPMFLWMSDSVINNKFYQKKFINAKAKTDNYLTHNNLFDSLLDCAGVNSKFFDRNLSLCKK